MQHTSDMHVLAHACKCADSFFCNAQVLLTFEHTFPLLRFDEAAVAALQKAVLRRALGLPADAGSWD